VFKVGVELTLSGPAGPVGQLIKQGIEVWLANHKGATAAGALVQVVYADDGGTSAGGASAARQLAEEDKVNAVVGPFASDAASASLPIFDKDAILDVPITAYAPAHDPKQFPLSFPAQYSASESGTLTVKGVQAVHAHKPGLLVANTTLATQLQGTIKAAAAKTDNNDVSVVDAEQYPTSPTDLTTQVQKLKAAGADSIILPSVAGGDYTVLFQAMNSIGWSVPVIGSSPAADPRVLATIPPALVKDLYVTQVSAPVIKPVTPAVTQFAQQWQEVTGKPPVTNIATLGSGYDAVALVQWAFDGAGSTSATAAADYMSRQSTFSGVVAAYSFTSTFRGIPVDQGGTAQASSYDAGVFDGVK